MAKVLDEFDFEASQRRDSKFDEFLDGRIHELEEGDDFEVDGQDKVRRGLHGRATVLGKRAVIRRNGGNIVVKAEDTPTAAANAQVDANQAAREEATAGKK